MSQAQPLPTSQPSSLLSSTTSSRAAPTRPLEHHLRFAENEQDAIEIHRFLLTVATPVLRCPVNFLKSLIEVRRVVFEEAALMLFVDEQLVGTMGIINPVWWYGDRGFLTDRWHFVLREHDGTPASQALLEEADRIALASGVDFIHQGRMRRRREGFYVMWPRVTPAEGGG